MVCQCEPTPFLALSAVSSAQLACRMSDFNDLRHGYATALLRQNVHPKIVSEALGHTSVGFTLDTYSQDEESGPQRCLQHPFQPSDGRFAGYIPFSLEHEPAQNLLPHLPSGELEGVDLK
jgi:hypothetical protein